MNICVPVLEELAGIYNLSIYRMMYIAIARLGVSITLNLTIQ